MTSAPESDEEQTALEVSRLYSFVNSWWQTSKPHDAACYIHGAHIGHPYGNQPLADELIFLREIARTKELMELEQNVPT